MLQSLRLQNFRCFQSLEVNFSECGAIFVGENAQGKTSLLEAICVLMRLQSPRTKGLKPLGRFREAGFGISGEYLEKQFKVLYRDKQRFLEVNQNSMEKSLEYLQQSGLIVWMGNHDTDLIRGGAKSRRSYIDFICSQLDGEYRSNLYRYKQILKMRNALLRQGGFSSDQLEVYSEMIVESADYICGVRAEVIERLSVYVSEVQQQISKKREEIRLVYQPSFKKGMRRALEESVASERKQGKTLVGPQRDEVSLLLNDFAVSDYSSEGQQRTLALSMKLAQGVILEKEKGQIPMYLLDDIFGELDASRRQFLLEFLPPKAQKFITTTSVDRFKDESLPGELFQVSSGVVTKSPAAL